MVLSGEQSGGKPLRRLQVTSKRLQIAVLVLIALTPVAVCATILTGAWADLLRLPAVIELDASRITGFALIAVIVLGSIKPAAILFAFWRLYRLLGLYREGTVFTAGNVAAIRKIGWALVTIDIAGMAQTIATGPALSLFGVVQRHISLRPELAFLTVGLFVVLVAHVMELGRELKEQDSLVI